MKQFLLGVIVGVSTLIAAAYFYPEVEEDHTYAYRMWYVQKTIETSPTIRNIIKEEYCVKHPRSKT